MTTHSEPVQWPSDLPPAWSCVPKTTVSEFLARCFELGRDDPALLFDDGLVLSFSDLQDRIERFAGYVAQHISPGDRVALAIGNRAEYLVAYFGIIAARGIAISMSPTIGPQDSAHVINEGKCVLAFADNAAADVLATVRSQSLRHIFRLTADEPDGLMACYRDGQRLSLADVRADPSELIEIGFTSGTTGLPKALAGNHLSVLRYVDVGARGRGFTREDRMLIPLQFHYGDPVTLAMAGWNVGAASIIMRKFSVSRFWDVARECDATMMYSIGSIPNLLLTAPPGPGDRTHRIRLATAVGVPKRQHRELNERFGFPWLDVYGSSESGPALATPPELAERYVGTGAIGIPYPEIEVRLVSPDGVVVDGPGEGELELRGEILFEEYLDNPEATESVLHDGYYRSGDLMRRDEQGMYYFVGRSKELIRRGGENIAPAEVEAALRLHHEVIDAAVVPVEDDIRGEEVLAHVQVVAPRPGLEPDLVEFCAQRLAPFKVPRYINIRQTPFPRTPSQRIQKQSLKIDGRHDSTSAWDRQA